MSMDIDVKDWTPNSLVMWLDKKLRDPHIGQAEMLGWLSDIVKYLNQTRDIPLAQLMRCKFVLARKLSDKLKEIPAFDGAAGGEEEQCALVLDSLSEIEYWTRNVAKHSHLFYLPTPTGRFFPDFVAKLKDGRILVVEYKGQQHAGEQETKDTRQKALIGEQWAENSNGQGVFVRQQWKEKTQTRFGKLSWSRYRVSRFL